MLTSILILFSSPNIYLNFRSSSRPKRSSFRRSNLRNASRRSKNRLASVCFRLRPDFIAHSILLTLRKYELLYLDVRSISLAHAVVSLFYLRIKKQSPAKGGRVRSMDSLHYSCLHMIYAVYIAFIKFSSVARTSTILLLRANNERFENSLIDRRPVRPPFHLRPFFKDARGDNPPSMSRASAWIPSRHLYIFLSLFLSFSPSVNVSLFFSPIDAKREYGLSVFPPPCASVLSPSRSSSRGVAKWGWRNFRRVSIRT